MGAHNFPPDFTLISQIAWPQTRLQTLADDTTFTEDTFLGVSGGQIHQFHIIAAPAAQILRDAGHGE